MESNVGSPKFNIDNTDNDVCEFRIQKFNCKYGLNRHIVLCRLQFKTIIELVDGIMSSVSLIQIIKQVAKERKKIE